MAKRHIIFTRVLGSFISIWILLAIVLWLLQYSMVTFGFFACVLSLFLYQYVFKLKKHRWPHLPALILNWLGFVVLMVLMKIVLDLTLQQESKMTEQMLQAEKQASTGLQKPGLFFRSQSKPLSKAETILSQQLVNFRHQAQAAKISPGVFQLAALSVLILFGLAGAESGKRFLFRLLPNAWLEKGMFCWSRIFTELGQYARVGVIQLVLTFVIVAFALYLLKIPYFLTWALMAAFTSLIPYYLGLILGMIPPILSVYLSNMPVIEVGGILIAFAVLNLFIRLVTLWQPGMNPSQPRFYELPFLLCIGWLVAQLWGLLLAIPIAVGLRIIRNHFLYVLRHRPGVQNG